MDLNASLNGRLIVKCAHNTDKKIMWTGQVSNSSFWVFCPQIILVFSTFQKNVKPKQVEPDSNDTHKKYLFHQQI